MEQQCIRHTDLPGVSPLFADLLYRYDRVARFYPHAPFDPTALAASAASISYPDSRRRAIVAALERLNPGNPMLAELAKPGTVTVVTGQQVGLYGGPLYGIFKALAAVKLAANLRASGISAVPVFWLATEDHDLAEINQSWTYTANQTPVSLSTRSGNPRGGPVGPIALEGVPIEELRKALAGLPFADKALQLASGYRDGETFGGAFLGLFRKLLAPYEVLFLDPLDPAVRAIAAPFLAEALQRSVELTAAVRARGEQLEAAGYHQQVHLDGSASLLFRIHDGRRSVLKRSGELYSGQTVEALQSAPEQLSPNALLRPVMQDFLLPTAAYLGGPAELAYFAQSEPIYRALLGRMPVVTHRASFSILDHRAAKHLKRFGLGFRDLLKPEVELSERIAASLTPPDLGARFDGARAAVARELESLGSALTGFDPGLEKAFARSRRRMLYQLENMERKTARETLRRDARSTEAARYLHNLVFPNRHLQERIYGVLPLYATHGPDLLDRIYSAVEPGCPDHQVLTLD